MLDKSSPDVVFRTVAIFRVIDEFVSKVLEIAIIVYLIDFLLVNPPPAEAGGF